MNEFGEFEVEEPRFLKLRDGDGWRLDVIERWVREGKLKLCDVCGRPFVPRRKGQLRCSFKCRQEANRYNARRRQRRIRQAEREKIEEERRQEEELIALIERFAEGL